MASLRAIHAGVRSTVIHSASSRYIRYMRTTRRLLLALASTLAFACVSPADDAGDDADSVGEGSEGTETESGGTETGETGTADTGETDTGETDTGGEASLEEICAQYESKEACNSAELAGEWERCLWAEPMLLSDPCGEATPLEPRCLAAKYHGDGCGTWCEGEFKLLSWRQTDAGLEIFVDPSCEYTTLGDWEDWDTPEGLSLDELACLCAL